MAVEFNHSEVMKMFEKKREKFLTKTGFQGVVLAAVNSKVKTGLSQSAKQFSFTEPGTGHYATTKNKETGVIETVTNSFTGLGVIAKGSGAVFKDRIFIEAPLSYDVYLERRYGIMAKTEDELIPYMEKFEVEAFG